MIQKIRFNGVSNYKPAVSAAANPIGSKTQSKNLSFKGDGSCMYEETISLVDEVRRKAQHYGMKELKGLHDDGTLVTVEPTKKGIYMQLKNTAPEFKEVFRSNIAAIETKNDFITWYSPVASFMIKELDEGTVDNILQKYLTTVL